jgi:hypothetical protein
MLNSQVSLSHEDLVNWAELSNDNNPIHFDLEAARKVNLDSIVAHGKLALLPIKSGVNSFLLTNKTSWYQFKAVFRLPVKCDSSVVLNIEEKQSTTRFNLKEMESERSCIKGGVGECNIPEFKHPLRTGFLGANEVAKNIKLFTKHFPDYIADWIVIESLIFSKLVESHLDDLISAYSLDKTVNIKHGTNSHKNDSFVMQTSQETFFSADLVSKELATVSSTGFDLQYQIGNLIYFSSSNNDVCSLDIAILIDGEMRMLTRYGFILIQHNREH